MSNIVDVLWKRFGEKEAELDKIINEYIDKGIIKVDPKSPTKHSEVLTIVDHIENCRNDMIRYGNQWREFKRMEEKYDE